MLLIVGDFNFHYEDVNEYDTKILHELLNICALDQFVKSRTHSKGHILDSVIVRSSDNLINSVHVDCFMTDHLFILYSLNLKELPLLKQHISYRKS